MNNTFRSLLLIHIAIFYACAPSLYKPEQVQYSKYDVKPGRPKDSSLVKLIAPYSAEINRTMNDVIGTLTVTLEKKPDENSLGFLMTDAMLSQSQEKFSKKVDLAFTNYGGIRTNSMQPGKITNGSIYELMPFDNLVVLLTMNGEQLQLLMNHIASRGGWPVSGASYTIQNKMSSNVLIGGQPVDKSKSYVVALSDYIANGGDDCTMLINMTQEKNGYLLRDAIIDYVKSETAKGKSIGMPTMHRVQIIK